MKLFIHLLFSFILTSPIQDDQNCTTIEECDDLFFPYFRKYFHYYNEYLDDYVTQKDIRYRTPYFVNEYYRYKFLPTVPHYDPIDLLIHFGFSSDEASKMLKEVDMNVDKFMLELKIIKFLKKIDISFIKLNFCYLLLTNILKFKDSIKKYYMITQGLII